MEPVSSTQQQQQVCVCVCVGEECACRSLSGGYTISTRDSP